MVFPLGDSYSARTADIFSAKAPGLNRWQVKLARPNRGVGQSSANLQSDAPGLARPELVRVLESAARLQEVVPDAVLVGGSAAALWANHRFSYDHDHVLQDLSDRFDTVLEAIEATDGW